MREQTIKEHQLPVLDQQMVTALMCQVLGRQEIDLLKQGCCKVETPLSD